MQIVIDLATTPNGPALNVRSPLPPGQTIQALAAAIQAVAAQAEKPTSPIQLATGPVARQLANGHQ